MRLISSTSSNLTDLPEDLVVGNDAVVDEGENASDNYEGIYHDQFNIAVTFHILNNCKRTVE